MLDVILAVDDDGPAVDGGGRDGHVLVVSTMLCRWKLEPDGGANARAEGTTARRHSSAPVEVGLLALDFMALLWRF